MPHCRVNLLLSFVLISVIVKMRDLESYIYLIRQGDSERSLSSAGEDRTKSSQDFALCSTGRRRWSLWLCAWCKDWRSLLWSLLNSCSHSPKQPSFFPFTMFSDNKMTNIPKNSGDCKINRYIIKAECENYIIHFIDYYIHYFLKYVTYVHKKMSTYPHNLFTVYY